MERAPSHGTKRPDRPRSGRRALRSAVVLGCLALLTVITAGPATSTTTTVPNDATGAGQLATAMAATGFTPGAASFQTVPPMGTPHAVSNTPLAGFPTSGSTYAILTSGDANLAETPNTSGSSGLSLGGNAVRGDTDRDVSVLAIPFSVAAGQNCLTLDLRFLSDEFPEFVGGGVNDGFVAEIDDSTWTTSGNVITAPNNFAFDPAGDVISINSSGATSMSAAEATGTTYDGATPLLSASTAVTPGTHTLYLSIFDQGDMVYDSAVFIDRLGLGFVPDPDTQCTPGATPFAMALDPPDATNPVGTSHTVTATLTQGGAGLAGETVSFTVTGANPQTGTATTDATGKATFTYTGTNPGQDNIVACFDETGDGDCEASASATKTWTSIQPGNLPPVVDSGPDKTAPAGTDVVLDGSASDPDDGPVTPLEISWILSVIGPGDASSCTFTGTSTVNPVLNCTVPGNYLVQIGAFDGEDFVDDLGAQVTFTTSSEDTTPPECALASVSASGITVQVGDAGSGLASVVVTKAKNADVVVPSFTSGSTEDHIVTATKIKASKGSTVELVVSDVAGNTTTCDPVLAELSAGETRSFAGVPAAERFFSVSDAEGVAAIGVEVNGVERIIWSPDGKTIDLGELAAVNTIRVRVLGAAGTSATIMIWDGK